MTRVKRENCLRWNNDCPFKANPERYPRSCGSPRCEYFVHIDSKLGRMNTITETSEQLQQTARGILNSISGGMEKPEVKALRGVGYALLALVQFLRESEQAQLHITGETLESNGMIWVSER